MMLKLKRALNFIAFSHDILIASLAWYVAFLLRFNFSIPSEFLTVMLYTMPVIVVLQAAIFWKFGLYRGVWRYASIPDLKRIVTTALLSLLVISTVLLIYGVVVPRSVLILDTILLVLMMGGSRFAYRIWKEHRMYSPTKNQGMP
ncbi:MAG: polysaccharide biosynthesis protein, partial [Nitrosomonadales bacterium]|nr:polysaccharide biosynthesis protein [Nitrosomonadales bacterium]